MPPYIDQSFQEFPYRIHISNLPPDVNAKKITDLFGQFGIIVKLYLKRRMSKDSPIVLPKPYVILIYERQESINKIMMGRPYFMNNSELFLRRCLPLTRRYPYETHFTTNKILVRIPQENYHEILPNNDIIINYLKTIGGQIVRLERFEDRTVFIEFNDYDFVDICCLSRPHFINKQMIEIEKCNDEEQARRRAQFRQKNHSTSLKLSSTKNPIDNDAQSGKTISPTLTLNIDEQTKQLQLTYGDMNDHIENKHEQMISSLKNEIEQIMKERIRFQRLTIDYQQEQKRVIEENRQWKKLFSESLQEKAQVQNDGERLLFDATEKYLKIKNYYDQL